MDGYLLFEAEREIESGSFVEVEVTDSSDYDLVGVEVLTGERGI